MNLQQYYQSFAEKLQDSATVKTVYGEPIEASGRTIIPAARVVACGFGGGSATQGDNDSVTGATGGGGVSTTPIGIFEVTSSGSRFVGIGSWKKAVVWLSVGIGVGFILGRRFK